MSHRTLFFTCHHLLQDLSVFGRISWISVTFGRESYNAMVTKQNLGQRNLSVTINVLHDNGEVWCVFLRVTWFMNCETRIFLWWVKQKLLLNGRNTQWGILRCFDLQSKWNEGFKVCVTCGYSTKDAITHCKAFWNSSNAVLSWGPVSSSSIWLKTIKKLKQIKPLY